MKTKDINLLDKYFEKAVLALAVLFAGYVVWAYVLGSPYNVEIGSKTVTPDQVEAEVLRRKDILEKKITSDESPLPPMNVPAYTEVVQQQFASSLNFDSLPVPLHQPGVDPKFVGNIGTAGPGVNPPVNLPSRPAPFNVVARADIAVLQGNADVVNAQFARIRELMAQVAPPGGQAVDQAGIDERAKRQAALIAEEYVKLVDAREPRDFRFVSVQGEFDMDKWRAALADAPEKGRVPRDWWVGVLLLADVKLERQMFDPQTGAWGSLVDGEFKRDAVHLVSHLPGHWHYRDTEGSMSREEAANVVSDIRASQKAIAQAPFAPIKGIWQAPDAPRLQLNDADMARLAQLNSEIQELEEKIQTRMRALNRAKPKTGGLGGPARPGGAASPTPRTQPRGTTPRSDGGRSQPGAATPATTSASGAVQRLQQVIDRYTSELDALKAEKNSILNPGAADAAADDDAAAPPADQDAVVDAAAPEAKLPPLKLIAHDLNVKPDTKYRYRFRVDVINPLLKRGDRLPKEQKAQAEVLSIPTPTSDWSTPVTTDPEAWYFVIETVPGKGEAVFEIWRIFNGQWRSQEFPVQPGDPIGAKVELDADSTKAMLDMRINAVMVDLLRMDVGGGLGRTRHNVLFLDRNTGSLVERDPAADRQSPDRTRLQNDAAIRGRVVVGANPGGGAR